MITLSVQYDTNGTELPITEQNAKTYGVRILVDGEVRFLASWSAPRLGSPQYMARAHWSEAGVYAIEAWSRQDRKALKAAGRNVAVDTCGFADDLDAIPAVVTSLLASL